MTQCCCGAGDVVHNDCTDLLCPGGIPRVLTLSLTNSTCASIPNGDYTLTYNAGTTSWGGDVKCADDTSFGISMECDAITFDENNDPVYGFRITFSCTGASAQTTNVSCDPFHIEGTTQFGDVFTCCGCGIFDTLDWEIN
jgi:hypothetical protein